MKRFYFIKVLAVAAVMSLSGCSKDKDDGPAVNIYGYKGSSYTITSVTQVNIPSDYLSLSAIYFNQPSEPGHIRICFEKEVPLEDGRHYMFHSRSYILSEQSYVEHREDGFIIKTFLRQGEISITPGIKGQTIHFQCLTAEGVSVSGTYEGVVYYL